MAGRRTYYTIKEAKAILAKADMSINSKDGEYRVNFREPEAATEENAYYTNDIVDAIETGLSMRKRFDSYSAD